jgi:formylglycine-generating enzyme required for sulfatase activity
MSMSRLVRRLVWLAAIAGAILFLAHDRGASNLELASMIGEPTPSHPWVLIEGRSWQIESTEVQDVASTDEAEGTRKNCAPGMVEVQGAMKLDGERGSVEWLQDSTCIRWVNRDYPERCASFDRDKWLALSRELDTRMTHFCIDRFEYPNRKGAYPIIAVTWVEAKAHCGSQGKRLCTEDEWTFACEGEEAVPYPTGYLRDEHACVIDRPWKLFDAAHLGARDSTLAKMEVDYLWQGEASGARPTCRSPSGVYDMTGNVDEWTSSVESEGFRSILKGGYWGPVRARCRASTRAHDEDFYFYQQGFRCCADAPSAED